MQMFANIVGNLIPSLGLSFYQQHISVRSLTAQANDKIRLQGFVLLFLIYGLTFRKVFSLFSLFYYYLFISQMSQKR